MLHSLRSLQNHSEALGSDSSLTRDTVHTMDTMRYSYSVSSSNGNFNTRNPEEPVKVIENLASSNITKNTDFERKRSATIPGNDQMMK